MLGKFLAELGARLRIRNAFIKCTPGHPARGRAHARTKHVESLQRQSQAVAGVADQVFCRHPAVGELQFADWMGRDHLRPSRHTESLHARADDEWRNLCTPVAARARAREHGIEISDAGVRDETLLTVDNVSIVFAPRAGCKRSEEHTSE